MESLRHRWNAGRLRRRPPVLTTCACMHMCMHMSCACTCTPCRCWGTRTGLPRVPYVSMRRTGQLALGVVVVYGTPYASQSRACRKQRAYRVTTGGHYNNPLNVSAKTRSRLTEGVVEGYNVKNRDAFGSGLKKLLTVMNHYAGECRRCTAVFATAPQQVPPPPPTPHLPYSRAPRTAEHRLHATSHPTARAAPYPNLSPLYPTHTTPTPAFLE